MPSLPTINPKELEGPPYSLYEGIEYKEWWNGLRKQKLDELEHAMVRKLLPNSGHRIIDVGCGYGRLADCYIGRFQQAIMVDGSMSLLRQAVEMTEGQAIYIAADVTHLPLQTASFDAALMIRVFQHIQNSWACLSELHRSLCNDGRIVFNYWNKQSAWGVMQWLKGANKENPFSTEPAGVGSTLLRHHPKAIHRMLLESGFSKIQYHGVSALESLTGKTILGERWSLLSERLTPLFGMSKITTWILCSAIVTRNPSIIDVRGIGDLLQCPSCGDRVLDDKEGYRCLSCKRHYPVLDGIIDLRV